MFALEKAGTLTASKARRPTAAAAHELLKLLKLIGMLLSDEGDAKGASIGIFNNRIFVKIKDAVAIVDEENSIVRLARDRATEQLYRHIGMRTFFEAGRTQNPFPFILHRNPTATLQRNQLRHDDPARRLIDDLHCLAGSSHRGYGRRSILRRRRHVCTCIRIAGSVRSGLVGEGGIHRRRGAASFASKQHPTAHKDDKNQNADNNLIYTFTHTIFARDL